MAKKVIEKVVKETIIHYIGATFDIHTLVIKKGDLYIEVGNMIMVISQGSKMYPIYLGLYDRFNKKKSKGVDNDRTKG